MKIKVPKSQWEVFTTTYRTEIKCPKCGNTIALNLIQYDPKFSQYSWDPDKNWTQTYCSSCGELVVAFMTDKEAGSKELLDQAVLKTLDIQPGVLYKIKAVDKLSLQSTRNYGYIESYSPVLKDEDNFTDDWYRVVVMDERDSDGVIIHCGPLDNCKKYLAITFLIFEEA